MSNTIVFYDLETTGKSNNPDNVRIIEISAVKVDKETLEEIDHLYYKCDNDGVPIDPDATERHGMTESDLIGCPTFQSVAKEVYNFFKDSDIGGYYCTVFDIPILYYSFIRAGINWNYKIKNYDIYTLYRKYNSGKLADVYKRYTGNDLENAHEADADIRATLAVYREMSKRGEVFEDNDLEVFSDYLDMAGNFKIRVNNKGIREIYLNFGKHKGKSIVDVDKSYFGWIMDNPDFAPDTRHYAKKIYAQK